MHSDGTERRWTFTRRFKEKRGQSGFLRRLDEARGYFPELEGETVKVGITLNADGKADLKGKGVFFRSRNVSYYVMGHELTHLLQESDEVPHGEKSCDVFTYARSLRFCDEASNYVKLPKAIVDEKGYIKEGYRKLVHDAAVTAVGMRRSGKRDYIRWFERAMEEMLFRENQDPWGAYEAPEWILREETMQTRLEEFF